MAAHKGRFFHALSIFGIFSGGGDAVKRLKLWGAVLVLASILGNPEAAVAGAQRAMRLWVSSVAPALFPFLALMPVLTGADACAAYKRLFSKIMRSCFSLPGEAASAVAIGMISGSPGGSLAVARIASQIGMRRSDAARIALALGGVSPAYLILGVGYGLYGSTALGAKLALIQAAVQLAMLLILKGTCRDMSGTVRRMNGRANSGAISAAVESILAVCGYMVLFSSIAGVAAHFAGESLGCALLLAVDLPSGLAELAGKEIPGKMLIQGAAIGFGGLCISFQNLDALRTLGLKTSRWLAARCISAVLFACGSAVLLQTYSGNAVISLGRPGKVYAFSLLAAFAGAIPVFVFLSKKFFLNKRKQEDFQE